MADELYQAKRSEGAYKNKQPLVQLKSNLKFEEALLGMNHYFLCENSFVQETSMQQLVRAVREAAHMVRPHWNSHMLLKG